MEEWNDGRMELGAGAFFGLDHLIQFFLLGNFFLLLSLLDSPLDGRNDFAQYDIGHNGETGDSLQPGIFQAE